MPKPPAYLLHGAVFLVALLYGASYTILKTITPTPIEPMGMVAIRIIAATLIFWLIAPQTQKVESRKDWGRFALCALFGIFLNQILFIEGVSRSLPTNASVVVTSSPIMVLIVSAILLGEKITKLKLIGILLGFAGAFLLFTKGGIQFSGATFLGDIMVFINALSYGTYLVLVKPLMQKYKPIMVVKWLFTFGLLYLITSFSIGEAFGLPFRFEPLYSIDWTAFTTNQYLAVGYVIFFITVLVYFLNGFALQHLSSSVVGYYIYLQPVIATAIAVIFRGDPLTFQTVLFSLLIFLGVFLVSWKPREKVKTA